MLLRLLGEVTVRVLFSTDWLFIVSLKNSCNEKLLKFDLTEVGEIKMRSGKEGTHSKSFPENIKHRFYQKLLFLLMFCKKFCIKHKLLHRDELPWINFPSNKISIRNNISFISPYYFKNSLFSYGRKLLRCSYLISSINMEFTGTMAKVYRSLIEWRVQPQDLITRS